MTAKSLAATLLFGALSLYLLSYAAVFVFLRRSAAMELALNAALQQPTVVERVGVSPTVGWGYTYTTKGGANDKVILLGIPLKGKGAFLRLNAKIKQRQGDLRVQRLSLVDEAGQELLLGNRPQKRAKKQAKKSRANKFKRR